MSPIFVCFWWEARRPTDRLTNSIMPSSLTQTQLSFFLSLPHHNHLHRHHHRRTSDKLDVEHILALSFLNNAGLFCFACLHCNVFSWKRDLIVVVGDKIFDWKWNVAIIRTNWIGGWILLPLFSRFPPIILSLPRCVSAYKKKGSLLHLRSSSKMGKHEYVVTFSSYDFSVFCDWVSGENS